MKKRTIVKRLAMSALITSGIGLSPILTRATSFTWDGAPDMSGASVDNSVTTGTNWVGDAAPSLGASTGADWIFPAGVTNTSVTIPITGSGGGAVNSITFSAMANPYTLTQSGVGTVNDISFVSITNSSSNLQTINSALNLAGQTIKTPGGDLSIGQNANNNAYMYANSGILSFWLTHDVTVGVPQLQSASRAIYGANGPATTTSDATGTLFLNVDSGTGSSAGSNFTGQVDIWSGAVRISSANALGRTTNITFIHGTFVQNNAATAQTVNIGGLNYEHGFGRLELTGGITTGESIRIDGRQGDAADFDDVRNISGTNTMTVGSRGGAGHWNYDSDGGKLVLNGAIGSSSDPGLSGVTSSQNTKVVTLRGVGDIDVGATITKGTAGTGVTALRKQGTGTATLLGTPARDWDGGTLVEGGTLAVAAGVFSTNGTRIHVNQNANLDLSAISGTTLGAGKRLSGSGTVKGGITTNDTDARIQPGGSGSIDMGDLLAYSGGTGKLTLNDALNMNSGGRYDWNLDSLDDTPANAGATYDQLVVNGALTLGGTSTIDLSTNAIAAADLPGGANNNAFWHSNHSWVVLDQTSAGNTQQFNSLTLFGGANGPVVLDGGGDVGQFSLGLNGNGDVVVNYNFTTVPEPSTLVLAAFGMVGLCGYGIRRRRR